MLDQVLAQIRGGSLRPGDRLPSEYELMRMLRVGRSSVREALRGLISLGLVDTRPGRGAVVLSRVSSPMAHLQTQGLSIERVQRSTLCSTSWRCGRASRARRRSWPPGARPRRTSSHPGAGVELERQIAAGRIYSSSNVQFHLAIARASHNNVLKREPEAPAGPAPRVP